MSFQIHIRTHTEQEPVFGIPGKRWPLQNNQWKWKYPGFGCGGHRSLPASCRFLKCDLLMSLFLLENLQIFQTSPESHWENYFQVQFFFRYFEHLQHVCHIWTYENKFNTVNVFGLWKKSICWLNKHSDVRRIDLDSSEPTHAHFLSLWKAIKRADWCSTQSVLVLDEKKKVQNHLCPLS